MKENFFEKNTFKSMLSYIYGLDIQHSFSGHHNCVFVPAELGVNLKARLLNRTAYFLIEWDDISTLYILLITFLTTFIDTENSIMLKI